MDQRVPRAVGEVIVLDGTAYRLCTAVLRQNTIAYSAVSLEHKAWEDVLIRELFPQNVGVIRRADGTLKVPSAASQKALQQVRKTAGRGQMLEAEWLRPCGGQSRWIDAFGTSYVVRTFPRAIPFSALLKQGPVPLETAVFLLEPLLERLEAIHHAGLLHLHLMPEKLYLSSSGQLILDYDCLYDPQQLEGARCIQQQTFCCAPEVRLGNWGEIGKSADLYSCCAVLFEMLLGRPLWETEVMGCQLPHTLYRKLDVPQPLWHALTRLLCRGLHTLPRRRFSSVRDLRQDLLALLRISIPSSPLRHPRTASHITW